MLSSGGMCLRSCPCLAAWPAALLFGVLVWFAVVSCSPVQCAVVLCRRVVLLSCFLCGWFLFLFISLKTSAKKKNITKFLTSENKIRHTPNTHSQTGSKTTT